MSNNKKIGSSNTYLRLFDSADFFFSHHPIPTTCLLWHCNFLNDERFAMQDKSKEKNLNQNSTIILNVDKISSTLLRNILINLSHYFVNYMIPSIEIRFEIPRENIFNSLFQIFHLFNFTWWSKNNHTSRNIEKPDLRNYLSNEIHLVTGGSLIEKMEHTCNRKIFRSYIF